MLETRKRKEKEDGKPKTEKRRKKENISIKKMKYTLVRCHVAAINMSQLV